MTVLFKLVFSTELEDVWRITKYRDPPRYQLADKFLRMVTMATFNGTQDIFLSTILRLKDVRAKSLLGIGRLSDVYVLSGHPHARTSFFWQLRSQGDYRSVGVVRAESLNTDRNGNTFFFGIIHARVASGLLCSGENSTSVRKATRVTFFSEIYLFISL